MFEFIRLLDSVGEDVGEPAIFSLLIWFLAGKNLQKLIKQLGVGQQTGRDYFEKAQTLLDKYLDVYNQVDMSNFILDFLNQLTMGVPNKETLGLEDGIDEGQHNMIAMLQQHN